MTDPKKPVTMQMVAEKAGLSRSTVSYALRNYPGLPKATCKRVQQIAKKMGYRRNAYVSTLMAQIHHKRRATEQPTIGLIIHASMESVLKQSFFFKNVITGAQQRANELGYTMELFVWGGAGLPAKRLANILKTRKIIGVIAAPVPEEGKVMDFPFSNFACSTIGYSLQSPDLHRVSIDYHQGMTLLWNKIRSQKFTRPGLLISRAFDERTRHHLLGTYFAMQAVDKDIEPIPPCIVADLPVSNEDIAAWLKTYDPDVIICTSPEYLDQVFQSYQIRNPPELMVLNHNMGTHKSNGIRQPDIETGAAAVDIVVEQIHHNTYGIPSSPKTTLVKYKWVRTRPCPRHPMSIR